MTVGFLRLFAVFCVALIVGKLVSKLRLPAILGWLIAGVVFGPYLTNIATLEIMDALWYKITIKIFECFAGVMIGREIIFKKIAKSGKQIIGITFVQSIATFLLVSLVFALVFLCVDLPIYLAFIFGGIALATAPAPALSIVNEYHTDGPVTKTLIPLAAIDDVIGVIVFFTVISVVNVTMGGASVSAAAILGMIFLPFVVGVVTGGLGALIIRKIKNKYLNLALLVFFLALSITTGLFIDYFVYGSFSLNYLLIGMACSATFANLVDEKKMTEVFELYQPILFVSLIVVIINLGMPLDYRLIAGAGVFTAVYILSRAAGKIGGAFLGGKITKAEKSVTKYLGFTLLPHSGVSLVFTGIAASTLAGFAPELVSVIQGTIVAAAIINELIAVIVAKFAFKWAGEIGPSEKAFVK